MEICVFPPRYYGRTALREIWTDWKENGEQQKIGVELLTEKAVREK